MHVDILDRTDGRGTLSVSVKPDSLRVLSTSLEVFHNKLVLIVEIVRREDYGEDKQTSMVFGRGQSGELGALPKPEGPGAQNTAAFHGNYRGPSEF